MATDMFSIIKIATLRSQAVTNAPVALLTSLFIAYVAGHRLAGTRYVWHANRMVM